jgi:hypothetical protein
MNTNVNNKNQGKVFLDGNIYTFWGSLTFEFTQLIVLAVLVTGSCLYLVIKSTAETQSIINIILIITITSVTALTLALIRKYWTFKILTADNGLTFVGFLKKRHIHWEEIMTVEPLKESVFGNITPTRIGALRTSREKYYFPLAMIEKGEKYPQLKGQSWLDSNGNKKELTLQNCPFYEEIQKHLTSGSTADRD